MSKKKNAPRSVYLSEDCWRALQKCADDTESFPLRGINARKKKASVDALLRRIAQDERLLGHIIRYFLQRQGQRSRDEFESGFMLRPVQPVATSVARLSISGDSLRVLFPELNKDFQALMHNSKMEWERPHWTRTFNLSADLDHKCAELADSALKEGFCVIVPSETIAQLIVQENYQRTVRRAILVDDSPEYYGWFCIWWDRSENFYDAARRIAGSRWRKPNVLAPPEHWDEVFDFAEMYDFTITNEAKGVAERARSMMESALLVDRSKIAQSTSLIDAIPKLDPPERQDVDKEFRDDEV